MTYFLLNRLIVSFLCIWCNFKTQSKPSWEQLFESLLETKLKKEGSQHHYTGQFKLTTVFYVWNWTILHSHLKISLSLSLSLSLSCTFDVIAYIRSKNLFTRQKDLATNDIIYVSLNKYALKRLDYTPLAT